MLKNKIVITLFGLSIALLFISALVGAIGLPGSQGPLVIRFDKFADEVNLIGDFRTVFGLGVVVSFMVLVNFLLARAIYERERFLSYIFAVATLIISFLFLIAVSGIVAVN
jgi:hypothetical protein